MKFLNKLRILWRDHGIWFIALLMLLALMLGMLGFQHYYAARHEHRTLFTLLYASIQLFILQSGLVDDPLPWLLEIARWLAPATLSYAVIYGVLLVTREQVGLIQAHWYRRHVILCGLGEKGVRLVEDWFNAPPERWKNLCGYRSPRLIAIDPHPQHNALTALRERGLVVLAGSATDEVMLRKAGVHHARYLIAVTGRDEDNLEIAAKAFKLTEEASRHHLPHELICHVQVTNIGLRQVFYDHPLFAQDHPHFDGRLFNLYERGARRLLAEVAPDACRLVHGPDDPAPHVLIVGLSALGQQVVLQAARMGHYANFRPLRLTVIDAGGRARERRLRWLYPMLGDIVDWRYLDTADYGASPERLRAWAQDSTLAVIYVCLDDDAQGLSIARRYHQALPNVVVVAGLSQRTHLAELVALSAKPESPLFYPDFVSLSHDCLYQATRPILVFDLVDRACRVRQVLNEELDQLAKALHDNYRKPFLARLDPDEKKPYLSLRLRDWGHLPESLQDSNRYQADFLTVKLRLLGYRLRRRPTDPGALAVPEDFHVPEQWVETLARMEHNRWLAERRLAGWTQGEPRDDGRRIHPDLVPYDRLSPTQQEDYNRAPQRQLPEVLRAVLPNLGWSLEKLTAHAEIG